MSDTSRSPKETTCMKGLKRPNDNETTPRTRSKAKDESTPRCLPVSVKSSQKTGPVLRTPLRTPKTPRNTNCSKSKENVTKSGSSASSSKIRSLRSNTPSYGTKSIGKLENKNRPRLSVTPKSNSCTPRPSKRVCKAKEIGSTLRRSSVGKRNLTPTSPRKASKIPKLLENNKNFTPEKSESAEPKITTPVKALNFPGPDENCKLQCEGVVTNDGEKDTSNTADFDVCSDKADGTGSVDCKASEPSKDRSATEEVEKVVERMKKRRSTIGRGRKSGQSLGGRRSLCPSLPILSLEDQIDNIDSGLPYTSKISHLLDISLREAMRRMEVNYEDKNALSDMRMELITNSERIAGHVAYKMAGQPILVDSPATRNTKCNEAASSYEVEALKSKIKKLEVEYKAWKSLRKERKLACQTAEREFREAKSGETKIDEDNMKNLTSVQQNILASKPDYSKYIKEVQMAHEKTFFTMQEIHHTSNVISNFIETTKVVADTCYSAVDLNPEDWVPPTDLCKKTLQWWLHRGCVLCKYIVFKGDDLWWNERYDNEIGNEETTRTRRSIFVKQ